MLVARDHQRDTTQTLKIENPFLDDDVAVVEKKVSAKVDDRNDTVLNYFVAYITPYDTRVEKVDRMVLSPTGVYDTVGYTFYRIKQ